MDTAWIQHVTSILDYIDSRTSSPNDQSLSSARDLMLSLDAWTFFDRNSDYGLQIRTLSILQRLSYHDQDRGPVADIANWTLDRWLRVLQRHSRSVPALEAVGKWWLSRAQPCLARVHAVDGTSSGSSEGSQMRRGNNAINLTSDPDGIWDQAVQDAESRVHTADYVEARGYLQPATDYLQRAVTEATCQSLLNGHLLITAAEAYMSLGNVSTTRDGEDIFRDAILYLRRASNMPGFRLPSHLQRYLDDYGRFVG